MTETTYKVTVPSGREWTLRPLPKHFFLYFGQLPSAFSAKTASSLSGDSSLNTSALSEDEVVKIAIFTRQAVDAACVSPKITLEPKNADEISPFHISDDDFNFLTATIFKRQGGLAEGLNSFRGDGLAASSNSSDGKALRKATKRTARNKR